LSADSFEEPAGRDVLVEAGQGSLGVVEPGGLLAILGGGQLGRMTAMAARTMGYRVRVMDPEAACPASFVVDEVVVGKWDDMKAAQRLASGADAVTIEIEQIGVEALKAVAGLAPLRPGVEPIRIIQDKILQKEWLAAAGIPVGQFQVARDEQELGEAVEALGGRVFVKTARGGYDGRGQVRIGFGQRVSYAVIHEAWEALGKRPVVVERALELDFEISVMAARSPAGEVRCYPAARNHHESQILAWSVLPAGISGEMEMRAQELARRIISGVSLEGLLCVEMFVARQGKTEQQLLVNELAPRPHNSYHQSERACATSQFEQLVRTSCNLPLGETEILTPAAIVNLLGDVWMAGTPDFAAALAVPGVRLHLYEKREARPGRKMGHLSATGATGEEALKRVLEAKGRL
jgi:5-(carboxyamino)imidazole ribonucleotide synthase